MLLRCFDASRCTGLSSPIEPSVPRRQSATAAPTSATICGADRIGAGRGRHGAAVSVARAARRAAAARERRNLKNLRPEEGSCPPPRWKTRARASRLRAGGSVEEVSRGPRGASPARSGARASAERTQRGAEGGVAERQEPRHRERASEEGHVAEGRAAAGIRRGRRPACGAQAAPSSGKHAAAGGPRLFPLGSMAERGGALPFAEAP